jgi:FkbM family methyltransferase
VLDIVSDFALVMRLIREYPLYTTSGERHAAFKRFLAWQVAGRVHAGPLCREYVNGTQLLVKRRLGGRFPYVFGIPEFDDLVFAAHLLRKDEPFADVGANVGVYSVMAAACAGARCEAFEPSPRAFRYLRDNVALNRFQECIALHPWAVGAAVGQVQMTVAMGENNHVSATGDKGEPVNVEVVTLDAFYASRTAPVLLKMDVEGYETAVVDGAEQLLAARKPLALIVELAGVGPRYGFDEEKLHRRLVAFGYTACSYTALQRRLDPFDPVLRYAGSTNVLFVRDLAEAKRRVRAAPAVEFGTYRI